MSNLPLGISSFALAALLGVALFSGCAKRFGGPWPFGEDQTEDLAKYGPVSVQRIEAMEERAKQVRRGTPQEQEAFAAEMAKQLPTESHVTVRLAIIDMLSEMDCSTAGAVLYGGLKDPEPDVRVACCEAWAKRASPEATRILSETLSTDTDMDVRIAAAKALSEAGDPEAVKALGAALEDPDPALQYRAVASLKNVTGKDLGGDVKAWRQLAQQPDPPLRRASVTDRLKRAL